MKVSYLHMFASCRGFFYYSPSKAPKGRNTPVPPRTDTSTAPEASMPEDTEDTMRSVVSVTEYSVRRTRLEVPCTGETTSREQGPRRGGGGEGREREKE